MAINLLTGQPLAGTTDKKKFTNLLPELTRDMFKDEKKEPSLKRDFDTEAVLRPAPPEEPISQFMKKTAIFLGLRKTNEEKIAESQVIFTDARILSREKDIPIDSAITFERQKREADPVGAIKVFGDVLSKTPAELKNSTLKMHLGYEGAGVVGNDQTQQDLRDAALDSSQFVEDIWREYGERKIFPGIPIKITDVAGLQQSIGFSLTSMGAGLAFGVPVAFAPFPGARVAAWGIGTAASGKAAFEMSTYEIGQMYLELKNQESIAKKGRGITAEEQKQLKEQFASDARKFGLWEAIPEALSNLTFALVLTAPLTAMVGKGVAGQMITRLVGIYGEELLTETITEKGQSAIMQKAGLEPATKPITWKEAFKRIAPQTFLLSTILAGTGAVVTTSANKLKKSLKKEIGADHPKFKKMSEDIDKLAAEERLEPEQRTKEPTPLETGLAKKAVEKTTGKVEALTTAEQKAIEEVEIKRVDALKEDLSGAKQTVISALKEAGVDIGIVNLALEAKTPFDQMLGVIRGQVRGQDIDVNTVGFTENLKAIFEAGETLKIVEPTKTAPKVTPIEGEGELKVRGLAKGVEAKAIQKDLTEGLGDLPEFKAINLAEQANKAKALLAKSPEKAKQIAMGNETPPADILPESVFIAVENKAIEDGDVDTLRDLALSSSLTTEATTMGQRIRTLAERKEDSPVKAILEVSEEREKIAKKRIKNKTLKKAKTDTVNDIKSEIKKATPSKQTWTEFINSIRC